MSEIRIRNQISSLAKMHGLSLRSDAMKYLSELLLPINEVEREDWLDKIIEAIQKQPLTSSAVDKDIVQIAVHECIDNGEDESERALCVIDIFTVPKFVYNKDRKKFIKAETLGVPAPCIHGSATSKADLFNERYLILYQRTLRHDLFTPLAVGAPAEESGKKFQLKPVEYLLGSSAKIGEVIVLGMITQLTEGKYYLEDTTGFVLMDLTKANFHGGLFTENSYVLAEGLFEDNIFRVNALGFPPPEHSKTTRAYFGDINFFGGPSTTSVKSSSKLKAIEQENTDAMFVFLSDVWLDQIVVLNKLRQLFVGFSEALPTCFVFCGNFASTCFGEDDITVLREGFGKFVKILKDFPRILDNCKFVFVPGPSDPGPAFVLPRPALPTVISDVVTSVVPNAVFATNPCRIQYCTQEIVIYREDIVTKMCRNCIQFPNSETTTVPNHFVKTIISQGHLCPLPLHVSPVYWGFDHSLQLYPLPDVIVVADKYDPFSVEMVDTHCFNPGSFPKTDYSFKVYVPSTRQVEESKIGDPEGAG